MMDLTQAARKVVEELDARDINPFISLAKAALWLSSLVFLVVIVGGFIRLVVREDSSHVGSMVSAAQALTVIALSILGWHGYKGGQVLYLLRHWKGSEVLDEAPEPDK